MTTIVKAASAAHFLGMLPSMLGYRPSRSIVLVPFAGRRTCGAMRFDLPAPGTDVASAAATMIGMLCRLPHATSVAIVVYSDDAERVPPAGELVEALERRADACGLGIHDALFVDDEGWGAYADAAHRHPLSELELTPGVLPEAAPPPATDQSAGAALPPVDAARREHVARLLSEVLESAGPDAPAPVTPTAHASADDVPDVERVFAAMADVASLFERVATSDTPLTVPDTVALVCCLALPSVRDVALIQWATDAEGGRRALDEADRWRREREYAHSIAATMWGEGPRPEPSRLEAALAHCRRLTAEGPDEYRATSLTACAWLAWALGRSTHAGHYADEALALDDDLVIAELVRQFTALGRLPEWAFADAVAI